MTKLAAILGVIGTSLLLASLAPWPSTVGQEAPQAQAVAQAPELLPEGQADAAAQGRALFLAKGCATCHVHDAAGGRTGQVSIGPDLSHYQPDPERTARWLRDPAAIKPGTQMPNLSLGDGEIDALIAFLNDASQKPVGAAAAPKSCPVTQPADPPFTPPDTGSPNALDETLFWHGSESLWTQLPVDGVWRDLPHHERGYTQKIFFSRQGYDWIEEPVPALTISGRRLDAPGLAFEELEATNGFHPDVGAFMLIGVDIPTEGCWQLTGSYHGHELSFIIWLEAG